ncbi:CSS-motif domain-containing protein [Klebsiella pneumoniae subsp. pneumoniae]|nr:CSS-motif domain-containing protein [Klebsiella pneumoniae subsp. pneumoniae]
MAGCTPAGINLLRTIRQKNKYIDDIGIVNGNRILCTAGWGTLRSSILLSSPPYQTPSGYLLYPVRKDNVHLRNPGTVTIKHNIAVVSPALTFANVLNVNPDFYIALAVRNGQKQLFPWGKIILPCRRHRVLLFVSVPATAARSAIYVSQRINRTVGSCHSPVC